MWALIAQAAMAVGGALVKGKQEAKAIQGRNEEVKVANLQNALELAQGITTLEVQSGLFRTQAATAKAASERAALLGKGSAEAQAASAGVRGASVDAVIADIDRELGWAEADLGRTLDIETFNMNTRLRSLISGAKANVYGYQAGISNDNIIANAVVQGALVAGSTYVNNYFKYGG